MNPRIQELADEAAKFSATMALPTGESGDKLFVEKFAELIVRECIAQCEKNVDHEWLGRGSKLSAFNIKQHFGIQP